MAQTGFGASLRRIGAMVLRHWFIVSASLPRTVELVFWPMLSMLTWGFLQAHLAQNTSLSAKAASLFVGGVLLWEILVRGQLGFAVAFLEEIWSRNLAHLMMSPLRPWEFVASLMLVSLIKLAVAMLPVTIAASLFFQFNLFGLGIAFAAFFANLTLMGWALGLMSADAVLRWGQGAEGIAWIILFAILPLSCVYYPVATLPGWLQSVAIAIPATHVFEGLRSLVLDGEFRGDHMLWAFALNTIYLALGLMAFRSLLASARRLGSLVHVGD